MSGYGGLTRVIFKVFAQRFSEWLDVKNQYIVYVKNRQLQRTGIVAIKQMLKHLTTMPN